MSRARIRAARLRGVFVGAVSGVTAVAGHGMGGANLPGSAAVMLVVLCSTVVGAAASTAAAGRVPGVLGCLLIGQLLGHHLLGIATDTHMHSPQWSPTMIAAHLVTALVAAALIGAAERLFGAVASAVWRLVLILVALRDSTRRRTFGHRRGVTAFVAREPVSSGRVTRGPPSFAAAV